jgi:hypothetical protein
MRPGNRLALVLTLAVLATVVVLFAVARRSPWR